VPMLFPLITKFNWVRRLMFRTVSQTNVNYRGSSLSEGQVGAVHGGDRLPWAKLDSTGKDNFIPLTSLDWQVHVYGEAAPELEKMCEERGLALQVFPWRKEMMATGLQRNAAYLLRPDGYVAVAETAGSGAAIGAYLEARKLTPIS